MESRPPCFRLEIERYEALAAGKGGDRSAGTPPGHDDDFRTEIGEQHGAIRPRSEPRHVEHAHAGERKTAPDLWRFVLR